MPENRPYEDLRSLGNFLQERVPSELSAEVAAAAVRRRRIPRSRRWIAVIATAVVLAISNVALARASDPAVPGDVLYPLDRTYEWIADRFRPRDRVPERVAEARQLADAGDTDHAISIVNDILPEDQRLKEGLGQLVGSGQSEAVREKVKDLVDAASLVHEAAQTGDEAALAEAIGNVKREAQEVAESASNGNAGGEGSDHPDPENPSVTAPGQVENPSDTAPGQENPPAGNSGSQGEGQGLGPTKP